MGDGAVEIAWHELRERLKCVQGEVIEEALVSLYVNGSELATIMCTPRDQADLALGFLKNEGFIQGLKDVAAIYVTPDGCCVDVWLDHGIEQPTRRIITSGCGGGVTFQNPEVSKQAFSEDGMKIPAARLHVLFNQLQARGSLYARARGVHAAGLADGEQLLAMAEDVGRHNTLDKLLGTCLRLGIETRGRLLLATGRVSSEMMQKAAQMGIPFVASRNSPTSLSVEMARAWGITLVGYVRRQTLRVYSGPERLGVPAETVT